MLVQDKPVSSLPLQRRRLLLKSEKWRIHHRIKTILRYPIRHSTAIDRRRHQILDTHLHKATLLRTPTLLHSHKQAMHRPLSSRLLLPRQLPQLYNNNSRLSLLTTKWPGKARIIFCIASLHSSFGRGSLFG